MSQGTAFDVPPNAPSRCGLQPLRQQGLKPLDFAMRPRTARPRVVPWLMSFQKADNGERVGDLTIDLAAMALFTHLGLIPKMGTTP